MEAFLGRLDKNIKHINSGFSWRFRFRQLDPLRIRSWKEPTWDFTQIPTCFTVCFHTSDSPVRRPEKFEWEKFLALICFAAINPKSQPEVKSFKMDVYRKVTRVCFKKKCCFLGAELILMNLIRTQPQEAWSDVTASSSHCVPEFCDALHNPISMKLKQFPM